MIFPTESALRAVNDAAKQVAYTCRDIISIAAFIADDLGDSEYPPFERDDPRLAPVITSMRYADLPDDHPEQGEELWRFEDEGVSSFHHSLTWIVPDVTRLNKALAAPGVTDALWVLHPELVSLEGDRGGNYCILFERWCNRIVHALLTFFEDKGLPVTLNELAEPPDLRDVSESIYTHHLYELAHLFTKFHALPEGEIEWRVSKEVARAVWMLPQQSTATLPDTDFLELVLSRGGRLTPLQQDVYDIVKASDTPLSADDILTKYIAKYQDGNSSSIGNVLATMTASTILRHGPGHRSYRI